jgi:hypothetical protein
MPLGGRIRSQKVLRHGSGRFQYEPAVKVGDQDPVLRLKPHRYARF